MMAQRIVCRFCDQFFQFNDQEEYSAAQQAYEDHLGDHSTDDVNAVRAIMAGVCECCQVTKLIDHCPDNLDCDWFVCTRCKVIWGPKQGVSYEERKKNGV